MPNNSPKLDDQDFKFWKRQVEDDKRFHDTELSKNHPEAVIKAYEGRFHEHGAGASDDDHSSRDMMIENYLFIFANTALPSLFFQLPRFHIRSERLPFEAAVLEALLNKDFNEKDKEENQLAIIDALLPYGYGVIKTGYNSRTGKVKKNKLKEVFTGKTDTQGDKTSNIESDEEFIQFERSIGIRQSPKTVYLDSTQPFGKGNRITFEYERTLQQLIDSNLYTLSSNFISHFSAKAKDNREVKLKLNEMFFMEQGIARKLVWVDGWDEELAFVKTKYTHLPRSLLRFNKLGDILYNVSHGKMGLAAQLELNYLNELWKQDIDNVRNQTAYDGTGVTESGKKTMTSNDVGGMIECNRPPGTVFGNVQSANIDAKIFGNITNVREYLKLLLSVSGGRGGGPDTKLATVERNKALGDALRSSGLQDAIRDFLVDQMKQRIKNLLALGSPDIVITLTGENLVLPQTGKPIASGDEIQLGGQGGLDLNKLITGDIDIDFFFDVDVTSAQRPDFPVIREQIVSGATFAAQIEPKVNQEGKKIQWSKILEDYFSTFDTIPDAKKYITQMTEEERQRLEESLLQQAQAELPAGEKGATGPQIAATAPTEDSIAQAAESVPTVAV